MARLKSFPYFGGKYTHASSIEKLLPYDEKYVEPFGGSADVLLQREPSPVETYNDLDEDVVTFFKVLRSCPNELIRQLKLTPYSRTEFERAISEPTPASEIEQARQFFISITQSYNAKSSEKSSGDWSYAISTTARGRSSEISSLQGYEIVLSDVAERFKRVQIECRDAIDVIETHDSSDTVIYCDPPYPAGTRRSGSYKHEYDESDHIELLEVLNNCDGQVAISSYASDLYNDALDSWNVYTLRAKPLPSSEKQTLDEEVVYTNYNT